MTTANVAPAHEMAEESLVGAILNGGGRVLDEIREFVEPADFYYEKHGTIYAAALDMHDRELPVEPITLSDELARVGKLTAIGGIPKLVELAALATSTANAAHYARIIRKQAILRGLTRAASIIGKLGSDAEGDVDELLHQAETALSAVTLHSSGGEAQPLSDEFDELLAEIREAYSTKTAKTGLLTGYSSLDEILMGFWPGQLIIIAARPGQGKSTLGLNIAENFADREVPSLYVSLEMSKKELQERSLARSARVDSYQLRNGKLTPPEADRLPHGIATVRARGEHLLINDSGYVTLPSLKASATKLHRTRGIEAVFVDYLQLMQAPRAETRALEIGAITQGLKQLAMKLHIPIVAVSQMNRAIENRGGGADRRPQLSDLRDSGSLEQDADVVIFLHDKSSYDADTLPDGTVDVIVEKNRRGRTGVAKLAFVRKHSSFNQPANGAADAEPSA